jgi:hypothetical protein
VSRVLSIDAEYGWRGDVEVPSAFVPVIFCSVDVDTGERHHFWGRDPGLAGFLRDNAGALFVSHNMAAEAKYLLQLGLEPPGRWWDTMLAYRLHTNAEFVCKYGLLAAAAKLRVPTHVTEAEKKGLQEWIGALRFNPASPADRARIREYCYGDCGVAAGIYRRLIGRVPPVPPVWMQYCAEFCLAVARAELRGIPFDVSTYRRVCERKALVLEQVQSRVNKTCLLFRDGRLDKPRLLNWCAAHGIGWPLRRSPRTGLMGRSFEDEVFKEVAERHPFLEEVRQVNKTTVRLNQRDLPVDHAAGRHYPANAVFAQKTGRTSPKKSVFSAPKWMRWLIRASRDHVVISADFQAEEVMIAAHLSRDTNMLASYATGDPHMGFAVLAGAAPAGAKADDKDHPEYAAARKLYKTVGLAVLYGQTAHGIGQKTGMHLTEAQSLLAQHRRAYPDYWAWTRRYTQEAFSRGRCLTRAGWRRKVGRRDNPRSVANFAIQGTGSDLMRLAVIYLTRNKTPLLVSVHDGFLFEVPEDRLAQTRAAIDDALGRAVQQLLPGAAMRWKVKECWDRYEDDDGRPLWQLVSPLLTSSQSSQLESGQSQSEGLVPNGAVVGT